MKIAILASGSGSTFQHLFETQDWHGGTVEFLIVDRPCRAVSRAEKLGCEWLMTKDSDVIFETCRSRGVELVCLAGWLRKLTIPGDFVNRVMNIHPSLLPKFGGKGMYGIHVHKAVLEAGERYSGCTVHFVDDEYDHGPRVIRDTVEIMPGMTPEELAEAVKAKEKSIYPTAIRQFREGMYWFQQNQPV